MASRCLILSGLAAGLFLPVLPAWAARVDPASPDLPAVTVLIQAAMKRHGLDGVAAIAHHRSQVLSRGYFGDIGPGTAIPVASASKWIAGLVIMTLVMQGWCRTVPPRSSPWPS